MNFPERQHEGGGFCCFFCVVGYPPNWGTRPRYIDRIYLFCIYFFHGSVKKFKQFKKKKKKKVLLVCEF